MKTEFHTVCAQGMRVAYMTNAEALDVAKKMGGKVVPSTQEDIMDFVRFARELQSMDVEFCR